MWAWPHSRLKTLPGLPVPMVRHRPAPRPEPLFRIHPWDPSHLLEIQQGRSSLPLGLCMSRPFTWKALAEAGSSLRPSRACADSPLGGPSSVSHSICSCVTSESHLPVCPSLSLSGCILFHSIPLLDDKTLPNQRLKPTAIIFSLRGSAQPSVLASGFSLVATRWRGGGGSGGCSLGARGGGGRAAGGWLGLCHLQTACVCSWAHWAPSQHGGLWGLDGPSGGSGLQGRGCSNVYNLALEAT